MFLALLAVVNSTAALPYDLALLAVVTRLLPCPTFYKIRQNSAMHPMDKDWGPEDEHRGHAMRAA